MHRAAGRRGSRQRRPLGPCGREFPGVPSSSRAVPALGARVSGPGSPCRQGRAGTAPLRHQAGRPQPDGDAPRRAPVLTSGDATWRAPRGRARRAPASVGDRLLGVEMPAGAAIGLGLTVGFTVVLGVLAEACSSASCTPPAALLGRPSPSYAFRWAAAVRHRRRSQCLAGRHEEAADERKLPERLGPGDRKRRRQRCARPSPRRRNGAATRGRTWR